MVRAGNAYAVKRGNPPPPIRLLAASEEAALNPKIGPPHNQKKRTFETIFEFYSLRLLNFILSLSRAITRITAEYPQYFVKKA